MRLKRPVSCIIFDLDGVLLDTEPLYTEAARRVLAEWNLTYTWELKAQLMGRASSEGAKRVVETLGLPIAPEEYLSRRERVVLELLPGASPVRGAPQLVTTLSRRGFPMAIATSSERRLFGVKSRRHAWLELVSVVICGDDPTVPHLKPAPDIFLAAARAIGMPASRCLVFEDSAAGVEAARAAGMQVVVRLDPHLDRRLFMRADWIVDDYAELELDDCLLEPAGESEGLAPAVGSGSAPSPSGPCVDP